MNFVAKCYLSGDWVVSILYEGSHIEGSPFNVRVYDPGQIRVIGLDGSLASRDYTFSGKTSDGIGALSFDFHRTLTETEDTRYLTPSTPAVSNCCCSNGSAPCWSNPPFLIFVIPALWRAGLSARAPECQKLKTVG